jgi:hypothetical protein
MSKWNYFNTLSVDGYSFPTDPQINFRFLSQGFSFLNRGSFIMQYSFDGSTVHGDMDSTDASANLSFDNRVESKIWFRAVDGYGTVRVEGWGGWGHST